jgi:hypothetical protein
VRPFQPDFIGEWTENIVPDFAGRTRGGKFMVLLTAPHPTGGEPFWALGWSDTSLIEARQSAMEQAARWRLDFVEVPSLLDAGANRAE